MAVAVLALTALVVAGCTASSAVRLDAVSEPAREIALPSATAAQPDATPTPTPTPTAAFSAEELRRIDELSAAGYWDVQDGTTWEYRITTSTGFEVAATRTSRVEALRDDGVDVSITQEYRFVDDSFDPVTIVSHGRADAGGGYRESMQLAFNQAWRQAPDPVFDDDFTIPSATQLLGASPVPERIAIGPLGTGPFEEFERSIRTIRNAGAGESEVLGTSRELLCFTEVRAGEVEGPDGDLTPFERRADLCFVRGLGLVSSRVVAGEVWEEWTLVGSTSARA